MIGAAKAGMMGGSIPVVVGSLPSFIGAGTATGAASSASITLPKHASTASGDLMVAYVIRSAFVSGGTPPTGWTELVGQAGTSGYGFSHFIKIAGGSEPASYAFPHASASIACGVILTYRGPHVPDPMTDSSATETVATTETTIIAYGNFLTDHYGGKQVCLWWKKATGGTRTVPAGFTQRSTFSGTGGSFLVGDNDLIEAESVGTHTATAFTATSAITVASNNLIQTPYT